MPADRVYHVQHIARVEGEDVYRQAVSDLIFRGDTPLAVLTWGGTPGNEYPLLTKQLDPAQLIEFPGGDVDYLYDGVIEVPLLEQ